MLINARSDRGDRDIHFIEKGTKKNKYIIIGRYNLTKKKLKTFFIILPVIIY